MRDERPLSVRGPAKLLAVEYEADKGDGRAPYRHVFGEKGGKLPNLVTRGGTLMAAGGSYTVNRFSGAGRAHWIDNPPRWGNPAGRVRASRAFYRVQQVRSPKLFHPDSFRTIKRGSHLLTVGCLRSDEYRAPRTAAERRFAASYRPALSRICVGPSGEVVGALRVQRVFHPPDEARRASRNPDETGIQPERRGISRREGVSGTMPKAKKSRGARLSYAHYAPRDARGRLLPAGGRRHLNDPAGNPQVRGYTYKRKAGTVRVGTYWRRPRRNDPDPARRRRRARVSYAHYGARDAKGRLLPGRGRRGHYRRNPPELVPMLKTIGTGLAIGGGLTFGTKLLLDEAPFIKDASEKVKGALAGVMALATVGVTWATTRKLGPTLWTSLVPLLYGGFRAYNAFAAASRAPAVPATTQGLGSYAPGTQVLGPDGSVYVAVPASMAGLGQFEDRLAALGLGQFEPRIASAVGLTPIMTESDVAGVGLTPIMVEPEGSAMAGFGL